MPTTENVLTRTDDVIKWFLPRIEKFPRNYKFLFGDRMVEIQPDFLEHLIEAYYRKEKLASLHAASLELEKLRHLLQISTEMRFISFDQLEYATRSLNQIGSMVGGLDPAGIESVRPQSGGRLWERLTSFENLYRAAAERRAWRDSITIQAQAWLG